MATFKIYDAAGTGANMPYADATVYATAGATSWSSKLADNGDWAVFSSWAVFSGYGAADIAINYDYKTTYATTGNTYYHLTEVKFGAYGQLIGEISGLDMEAYSLTDGSGALSDKVINGGDDIFEGNNYADQIHGGNGHDTVYGGGANDVLYGDSGHDALWGGAGHDKLDGGVGDDTAAFSGGISQYLLDWQPNGDVIVTDLIGNQGIDYVTDGTEFLAFTDGKAVDTRGAGYNLNGGFMGTAGNDVCNGVDVYDDINGYAGNDILKDGADGNLIFGGSGNDWLQGNGGRDYLDGGSGKDTFVFNLKPTKANKDSIWDFNVKDDTILLENSVFKVGSSLSSSEFRVNTTGKAQDSNDKIIYDKDSGVLYYDADGTGSKAGVAFTHIDLRLKLSYHDFDII